MIGDPLRGLIADLKQVFVKASRDQAVSRQPHQIPTPRLPVFLVFDDPFASRYPFLEFVSPDPKIRVSRELIGESRRRFGLTASGLSLMSKLDEALKDPSTGEYRSTIQVQFTDPGPGVDRTEAGDVQPDYPGAETYLVTIPYEGGAFADLPFFLDVPSNVESRGWSYWPAPGLSCTIQYSYVESASLMADTLNHELTHVWYFHKGNPRTFHFKTGHGDKDDVLQCKIEDDFLAQIKAFMEEMEPLEKSLRTKK